MVYAFMIFMTLAAMVGGAWLFKLSDDNYGEAALAYALGGTAWAAICMFIAVTIRV